MNRRCIVVLTVVTVLGCGVAARASVTALAAPLATGHRATIGFDDQPAGTIANDLYQSLGIRFSRDDGEAIPLYDWSLLERNTTSPPNVLATVYVPALNTCYVSHLNVVSASPMLSIGAYVGNDAADADFRSVRLTVYDAANGVVGAIEVPVDLDLSVDQFVGLTSTTPFVRARFENLRPDGTPSRDYSVVIDDLSFTTEHATPTRTISWGGMKQRYR